MEVHVHPSATLTEDEKSAKRRLARIAPLLALGAVSFIIICAGLCLSGTINLAGQTDSLPDFGSRLEFTAKFQILGVAWLIILVFYVIIMRGKTGALNPLGGRDIFLQKQTNLLQNTFEQFIISSFSQICLVAYISGEWTMRTIPMVNYLFFLGRFAFVLGYPDYRTFGILLSLVPSVGMFVVGIYKFIEHQFIPL